MLSDNSIRKILKKAGVLRTSKNAIKEIRLLTEDYIKKIIRRAIKNVEYSGRKTLKKEDIQQALKQINEKEIYEI